MNPTARRPRRPRSLPRRTAGRLAGAVVAALLVATVVVACTGADEGSSSGEALDPTTELTGPDTAGGADADPTEAAGDRAGSAQSEAARGSGSLARQVAETSRSVIATGTISLRADDVEDARFDVQRVVDENGGEIADEETGTDREGEVRRSRLVLRVPVAAFDDVMTAVSEIADLSSATRSADVVTTQVIDTEVRVRAQRKSLERIEALLAKAEDLQDIVAIESQLASRQAELDSLEQQQAYLADQTSMATVTVLLERADDAVADEVSRAGFLIGLGDGWEALQRSTVAVLTVVGAVLPFVALLALVAVPGRLLLRRRAARRTARTPSAAPAVPGPSQG